MEPDVEIQKSVSLVWEIENFMTYPQLHKTVIESPPVSVKCSEIMSWYLSLQIRDDILDCLLHRSTGMDDLYDIIIKYKLFIIAKDGSMHFSKCDQFPISKEQTTVTVIDFLNLNQLENHHLSNGTLRLQLDLEVSVADNVTKPSESLQALSRDMLNLYYTARNSDKVFVVDGFYSRMHSFVIDARCPELNIFSSMDTGDDTPELISHIQRRGFEGIESFLAGLKLLPKSDFVKRSIRLCKNATRNEETLRKALRWDMCDPFFQYLYSGRLSVGKYADKPLDDDARFRLLAIARYCNLPDLVHRLQEVEIKSTVVTDVAVEQVTLDFDFKFLAEKREPFDSATRLVNLSNTGKRYLSVTFSSVKETVRMLKISCQLVEINTPVTIKTVIWDFNRENMDASPKRYEYFNTLLNRGERWVLPFQMPLEIDTRVKCVFSICSEIKSEISRQEYELSSDYDTEPRSLGQLSHDLATALPGCINFDLIIHSFTRQFCVHQCMVCARLPELEWRFRGRERLFIQFDSPITWANVIEYVYSGMLLSKNPHDVENLGPMAAMFFRLPELAKDCEDFLRTHRD